MPSDHEDTFHGMSFLLNLKHGRILCIRRFLLDGIVFCKHTVAMEGVNGFQLEPIRYIH